MAFVVHDGKKYVKHTLLFFIFFENKKDGRVTDDFILRIPCLCDEFFMENSSHAIHQYEFMILRIRLNISYAYEIVAQRQLVDYAVKNRNTARYKV